MTDYDNTEDYQVLALFEECVQKQQCEALQAQVETLTQENQQLKTKLDEQFALVKKLSQCLRQKIPSTPKKRPVSPPSAPPPSKRRPTSSTVRNQRQYRVCGGSSGPQKFQLIWDTLWQSLLQCFRESSENMVMQDELLRALDESLRITESDLHTWVTTEHTGSGDARWINVKQIVDEDRTFFAFLRPQWSIITPAT